MERSASVLARNILLTRRDRQFTQERLAQAVGVSPVTICRLEKGDLQDLKGATVARIADELGVSMDYLYGREATPNGLSGLSDHV